MIWKIFGGWQGMVLATLLAGSVATLAWYVSEYDSRGREIVRLEHALSSAQNEIKVLEANKKLATSTIDALNARLAERDRDIGAVCEMLSDIANSPEKSADETVDPLTGSVLEKLKENP